MMSASFAGVAHLCHNPKVSDQFRNAVQVIDSRGLRKNVGIILCNRECQVLWARRVGQDAWQFPQGGIQRDETAEQALYRELHEEVGLGPDQVRIMAVTRGWLCYRLPKRFVRWDRKPVCLGQKQRWYLLRLLGSDEDVRLDLSHRPEFDHWRWVNYWHPLREVVSFKRNVYKRALNEFAPVLFESRKQGSAAAHGQRQ